MKQPYLVYSHYRKQSNSVRYSNGIKSPTIQVRLRGEGIRTTGMGHSM